MPDYDFSKIYKNKNGYYTDKNGNIIGRIGQKENNKLVGGMNNNAFNALIKHFESMIDPSNPNRTEIARNYAKNYANNILGGNVFEVTYVDPNTGQTYNSKTFSNADHTKSYYIQPKWRADSDQGSTPIITKGKSKTGKIWDSRYYYTNPIDPNSQPLLYNIGEAPAPKDIGVFVKNPRIISEETNSLSNTDYQPYTTQDLYKNQKLVEFQDYNKQIKGESEQLPFQPEFYNNNYFVANFSDDNVEYNYPSFSDTEIQTLYSIYKKDIDKLTRYRNVNQYKAQNSNGPFRYKDEADGTNRHEYAKNQLQKYSEPNGKGFLKWLYETRPADFNRLKNTDNDTALQSIAQQVGTNTMYIRNNLEVAPEESARELEEYNNFHYGTPLRSARTLATNFLSIAAPSLTKYSDRDLIGYYDPDYENTPIRTALKEAVKGTAGVIGTIPTLIASTAVDKVLDRHPNWGSTIQAAANIFDPGKTAETIRSAVENMALFGSGQQSFNEAFENINWQPSPSNRGFKNMFGETNGEAVNDAAMLWGLSKVGKAANRFNNTLGKMYSSGKNVIKNGATSKSVRDFTKSVPFSDVMDVIPGVANAKAIWDVSKNIGQTVKRAAKGDFSNIGKATSNAVLFNQFNIPAFGDLPLFKVSPVWYTGTNYNLAKESNEEITNPFLERVKQGTFLGNVMKPNGAMSYIKGINELLPKTNTDYTVTINQIDTNKINH